MKDLTCLVFAVVADLIFVDRLIQLPLLTKDTNLAEETFHTKGTRLIHQNRHHARRQRLVTQECGQYANIGLRGRYLTAFCSRIEHGLECRQLWHLQWVVGLAAAEKEQELRDRIRAAGAPMPQIVVGPEGQTAVAVAPGADTVVTGVVGVAGLLPTIEAIKLGRTIALANKETLIAGGPVILPLLKKYGAKMTPADSEHSAIFQCLQGVPPGALRRIILTASGGAFRDFSTEQLIALNTAEPETVRKKASTHPNWDMGAKITVDSSTMMNKGLEVIEAHYLFGCGYDDIEIVVHPQSIVHSAVETSDTSVIAQLGWPDMRLPILYSMSWPHRLKVDYGRGIDEKFDLVKLGSMSFKAPDVVKYPCIPLAYAAGRQAGTMTGALNAANEMANELFRAGSFDFFGIPKVIEKTMEAHQPDFLENPSLEDIVRVDAWAREQVKAEAKRLAKTPILL